MDNMEANIANEVIDRYDEGDNVAIEDRIAAGQARYNAWFGTATKRKLYGKFIPKVNMLLETTTSPKTGTDYSECIVVY